MAKILVVAEQRNNKLKSINFEVVTIAKKLSDDVDAIAIGSAIKEEAKSLENYGASIIHTYENADLENYSPEAYSKIITKLVKDNNYEVILLGTTSLGRDLAAHLGAKLEAGVAQDCIELNSNFEAKRPIFAGKAIATVKLNTEIKVFTIRANSVPVEEKPSNATIKTADFTIDFSVLVKEILSSASKKLDVAEASKIITGGRGMGGPENWNLIEDLATTLGAATGASRAVVDAGWRPHSEQVGQTGKVVSPQLYIACGVSGAIQHLAGMKTSKYIVAINKDPEAPIFKIADYGIVGDVHDVLPKLNEAFKTAMQ